jgi:hypothetical protein
VVVAFLLIRSDLPFWLVNFTFMKDVCVARSCWWVANCAQFQFSQVHRPELAARLVCSTCCRLPSSSSTLQGTLEAAIAYLHEFDGTSTHLSSPKRVPSSSPMNDQALFFTASANGDVETVSRLLGTSAEQLARVVEYAEQSALSHKVKICHPLCSCEMCTEVCA